MNFYTVDKNQFLNIYICIKFPDFEETSQRNDYIRNRGDYAEDHCCTAELPFY